jgi:ribonuclease HI
MINIYFDGGSKNNQSSSERQGYGSFRTYYQDKPVTMNFGEDKTNHLRLYFPGKSNNEAEYATFIVALAYANELQSRSKKDLEFHFYTDSALVHGQIHGEMQVKAKNLLPYYEKAIEYLGNINSYLYKVPREEIVERLGH